jgi:hypothetical protein
VIEGESSYRGDTGYADLTSNLHRYDYKVHLCHARVRAGRPHCSRERQRRGAPRVDRTGASPQQVDTATLPGLDDYEHRATPDYRIRKSVPALKNNEPNVNARWAHLFGWVRLHNICSVGNRGVTLNTSTRAYDRRPPEPSKVRKLLAGSTDGKCRLQFG